MLMSRAERLYHRTVTGLLLLILLLPLAATLIYALATQWGATILPDGFTLKWLTALWSDPRFLQALWHSLLICFGTLLLSVVVILPAMFVIAYYFPRLDAVMNVLILLPFAVPPVVSAVGLMQLFAADPLPRPYVLKPVNEGSSVGVAIVTPESNVGNPIHPDARGPWQEFDELLAEPFIRGRELTTAVLGDQALGVTELKPKNGFYDYDAKYTDGLTEHVFPAQIPDDVAEACKRIALDAHRLLGCKGASRADFRWDDTQGVDGLFLLEVNTQPGMTETSLVPEMAAYAGYSFGELVRWMVEDASCDR
jgi:hypothetical protein